MRIKLLFNIYFLMTTIYSFSQINETETEEMITELQTAGCITNDQIRLQKYDEILEKYGIRTKESIQIAPSKWRVSVNKNPIDDSKKITFVLTADSGKSTWGNSVGLVLRFDSNKTEVYIVWNDYLGSDAFVTTRIGEDIASQDKWPISTDSKATFYPGDNIDFINKIIKVDKVVFQVTPYNESPITAIFDVRGLKSIVQPYISDLNWW